MKLSRALPGLCAICAASIAIAGTPADYYATANTANSATLRTTLNTIVTSGEVTINFNNDPASFAAMKVIDEDPDDSSSVKLIYTGDSRLKSLSGINGNSDPASGGWNREHAFPKSFFNLAAPMINDLVALFPCDADVNSLRNNNDYDNVTTPTNGPDAFGDKLDTVRNIWEPGSASGNISKGRVARAALYMDVRYEGFNGDQDLQVLNTITTPTRTGGDQLGYLNTLLSWHQQYPPDAFERTRNSKVYNAQFNANPFVEHPEYASTIFGGTAWSMTDGTTLSVSTVNRAPNNVPTYNATNTPLMSLDLGVAANEWHIASVSVSQIGTATDAETSDVRLYHDVDNDGLISTADSLLDTRTFSGGNATFTLAYPFYLAPGTMHLLIAFTPTASATNGHTVQLRLNASGIIHSATGGNDIDPTFSLQNSGAVVLNDPIGSIDIRQIYGGGGNSGATYQNDYIEIYNRGTSDFSLSGWSIQYASATNTSWALTPLTSSTLAAGHRYLIQEASNAAVGAINPTPDTSGTIILAAGAGKVALVTNSTALSGGCPSGTSILDFVGYGTTADCFEGAGRAPAPSSMLADIRNGGGATDSNNNNTDFTAAAPNPSLSVSMSRLSIE